MKQIAQLREKLAHAKQIADDNWNFQALSRLEEMEEILGEISDVLNQEPAIVVKGGKVVAFSSLDGVPREGYFYAAQVPGVDHDALVRELDVLLNGEEGAAPQAQLCDIVAQVKKDVAGRGVPLLSSTHLYSGCTLPSVAEILADAPELDEPQRQKTAAECKYRFEEKGASLREFLHNVLVIPKAVELLDIFEQQVSDTGEYSLDRYKVKQLVSLGLLRWKGGSYYEMTNFGVEVLKHYRLHRADVEGKL